MADVALHGAYGTGRYTSRTTKGERVEITRSNLERTDRPTVEEIEEMSTPKWIEAASTIAVQAESTRESDSEELCEADIDRELLAVMRELAENYLVDSEAGNYLDPRRP